jgi:hypothetical protein
MNIYTIKKGNNYRYYLNGKLHREFGPAIIHDGSTYWFKNGIYIENLVLL